MCRSVSGIRRYDTVEVGAEKPNRFVCLVGEKGKVVLTFFTEQ